GGGTMRTLRLSGIALTLSLAATTGYAAAPGGPQPWTRRLAVRAAERVVPAHPRRSRRRIGQQRPGHARRRIGRHCRLASDTERRGAARLPRATSRRRRAGARPGRAHELRRRY